MFAHIAIDYVDGQKQSLGQQLEVVVCLNEPVHQRRPDSLRNLVLARHVRVIWVPFLLVTKHVLVDFAAEFGHMVHVAHRRLVVLRNLAVDLFLATLMEQLQFLVKRDARKLLSGTPTVGRACSLELPV